MSDLQSLIERECDYCGGRGFQLDWIDPGGVMRAVPGDTCRHCDGSGRAVQAQAAPERDGQ